MVKISQIPAPAIAGVIREKTCMAATMEIQNCIYDGADMIDLHLSCLEDSSEEVLKKIIESSRRPVLALNYNRTADWQVAGFTEEERTESLLRAVRAGAAAVDIQGYTFHAPSEEGFYGEDIYSFTKDSPKEVVTDPAIIEKQCEFIEKVHAMGAEVLLSCHPAVHMSTDQVVELALFLEKRNPDVIKLVPRANNEDEMLEGIKTMLVLKREVKTPVSFHTGGTLSPISRLLNPALGGQIAFCVDRFSETATSGQLDLRSAKTILDNLKKFI